MGKNNYYKVLGVDSKATDAEIRTNYRKLARLYHPDLNKGRLYHEKFVAINQAYSVLRDETSRRAYDFQLREAENAAETPKVTYGTHTYPNANSYQQMSKNSVQDKNKYTEHFAAAKKAFGEKSFVKAMKEVDLALNYNDKSYMAHELKGDIFVIYSNYEEAQKEFELAFKYNKINNPKIKAKIDTCIEKQKPEKKGFFSRLKNKLFEVDD